MLQSRLKNPERKIEPRGCIQADTVSWTFHKSNQFFQTIVHQPSVSIQYLGLQGLLQAPFLRIPYLLVFWDHWKGSIRSCRLNAYKDIGHLSPPDGVSGLLYKSIINFSNPLFYSLTGIRKLVLITGNSDMHSQEMTLIKPDNITESYIFPAYRYPLDDVGEASG